MSPFPVLNTRQHNFSLRTGALLVCLLVLFLPRVAKADGLVLTIDSNITAIPNSSTVQQIAITGSVQNNFSFSVLTSLSEAFPDPGLIICNTCSEAFNYNQGGGITIAAGASTGDITLTTLTIGPGGVPDSSGLFFLGHFTIFSSNGNSNTVTATVGSAVAEPSSLLLLSTGLIGGIGAMRRRFPK